MLHFSANGGILLWQAVYKMSLAAALTRPNPLTAEECTNRVFARLDKDNNGEESVFLYGRNMSLCSGWMWQQCLNHLDYLLFWFCSIAIISLEEFIDGALDDDWIREMLECDPSTVKVERPLRRDAVLGIHGWPQENSIYVWRYTDILAVTLLL